MKIFSFYHELVNRNKLLAYVGLGHLMLFIIFLGLSLVDTRTVMGINTWIKPMKFALSIWIYLWTIGWYLHYLPNSRRSVKVVSWGIAFAMVVEMICIGLQAGRGVPSHFNNTSAFDGMVFSIMGSFIMLNTLFLVYVTVLFFLKKPALPSAYLWAIRIGLLLLLFSSAVGGMMVGNNAHSVGVADGGAGLPFVNWSREGGDLRIAHFIGIHGLQAIPLFAFLLGKYKIHRQKIWTALFAVFYVGITGFLFWQAMQGRPLMMGME